ncbi:hypothetical protein FCM35_KLT17099 [Carex littledalei]|uniref:Uncharacterized protein n=1 Tax=Carex littledalei TaxID=544730 RepID=A0A833VFX2_9POAL|nr:hypothetical protein FCM35_KLT17099 [Carex littledalei]
MNLGREAMNLGSGDRRRGDEPRKRRSEARRRTSVPEIGGEATNLGTGRATRTVRFALLLVIAERWVCPKPVLTWRNKHWKLAWSTGLFLVLPDL